MPARKKTTVQQEVSVSEETKTQNTNSDSENTDLSHESILNKKPSVIVKYSSNDSDRIQLAQAINNLTIKSEQFMEALKSFETFKENIAQLDIQIEAKKREFKDAINNLELSYNNKTKNLENEYLELNKHLQSKYQEINKRLESDYQDKNKNLQNEFKNNQIDVKQKLSEFKIKACEDISKEFSMMLIKNEDHKNLLNNVHKANQELEELKKSFSEQCNLIRNEEKIKYQQQIKLEVTTLELNHKANVAELRAQVEQQKKEIDVLQKTIDNLKHEIAEQRNLTKEVAQASSKSQINQKFGKD